MTAPGQLTDEQIRNKSKKLFRELRDHYRKYYEAGKDDATFHTWIEIMIDRDRKEKKQEPIYEEE